MKKLLVLVGFWVLLVCGHVQAASIANVTVKKLGILNGNAGASTILVVSVNEAVSFVDCPVATSEKQLMFYVEEGPDALMASWMTLLIAAQAKNLKVDFFYEGCNGMFGAPITAIITHP